MIIDSINMECICINYCNACSIPNSWAVLQQPLELRRREQAPFSGNPLGVRHPADEDDSLMVFPECVARVPVSLWGSGG